MSEQHLSTIIVGIVVIGVTAQWVAWRSRLPAIVLLAASGLVIGPVLGWVDPAEAFGDWLQPTVSLSVAIILFEGGLSLDLRELRGAAQGVRRLVYLGAPLTWLAASLAAYFLAGLEWPVALVFGAIMVVTGPTVIIPLLRQAKLNRRTASYLKWEGIINDPIGALLAVLTFQFFVFVRQGSGIQEVLLGLGAALLSGVGLGGLGGWLIARAFLRGMVPEYLKSPVLLGSVLAVYEVSNALQHEAGLLAVTVMGIVVANMHLPGIHDMKRFKEYITVMLVAVVFVLLTANLDPAILGALDWRDGLLVLAILLVVRPLVVGLVTLGTDMDLKSRLLVAWIAPRGIVAAATAGVMGPGLAEAGYVDAQRLLPIVFAVIFATVLAHGGSIGWLAKRLGLGSPMRDSVLIVGASPWTTELAVKLKQSDIQVLLADSSWHSLRAARLAGVPVFYGEILSDFAEESVEVSHVAAVLAATSNDAYNALVCSNLAPEIGQPNVYQLAMDAGSDRDPKGVARPSRGRVVFSDEMRFESLWRLHVRGWKFYGTTFTDAYTYTDFLASCAADSFAVMMLRKDGRLQFSAANTELEPEAGDTLIYYSQGRDAERPMAKPGSAVAPAG